MPISRFLGKLVPIRIIEFQGTVINALHYFISGYVIAWFYQEVLWYDLRYASGPVTNRNTLARYGLNVNGGEIVFVSGVKKDL